MVCTKEVSVHEYRQTESDIPMTGTGMYRVDSIASKVIPLISDFVKENYNVHHRKQCSDFAAML